MADQVIAMAPRLPVRDQATLRRQFPGCSPEELADALIRGSSRAAASVGAAVGASMVLPVIPAVPVEIAAETLALVGIELKLIAELHEVYGVRAAGSAPERMAAYVGAWANRRGVALAPGGIVLAVGIAAAPQAAAQAARPRRAECHVTRAVAHRRHGRRGAEPARDPPPRPRHQG